MIKLLIIDDEPFVREGLIKLMNWDELGFEIVGEAGNGKDGVEKIISLQPEVVLTDIKMPEMNGLELIEKCSTLEIKTKFIILSGYNDFSYVKKAIKYGVKDYILKPIDEDELKRMLDIISKEIQEEEEDNKEREKINKAIIQSLYRKLLKGIKDQFLLDMAYKDFAISAYDKFRFITIEVDDCVKKMKRELIDEEVNMVKNHLNALTENVLKEVYVDLPNRFGFIVREEEIKGKEKYFLENKLQNELRTLTSLRFYIVMGDKPCTLEKIGFSYECSLNMLNHTYLNNNESICWIKKDDSFEIEEIKNLNLKAVFEAIEENKKSIILKTIEECFVFASEKQIPLDIFKSKIIDFKIEVLKLVAELNGSVEKFKKHLQEGIDYKNLREDFVKFCIEVSEDLSKLRANNQKSVLVQIEKYVRSNYDKDISLKVLSEKFYINPVYLGQIFKKHFGMYFNDYLNTLRIEEAKKYLRRTDLKIYEVALKVGYNDPNYFISKFEKITNTTPLQYKKIQIKDAGEEDEVIQIV